MPIYPYRCESCNLAYEVIKPMSEANELESCPKCSKPMTRVFTPIAFSFGWRLSERSLYGGKGTPKDELERAI